MPGWLKGVLAVVILIALACLVVFCIACSKDMTFVEYIKSWFDTAKEVKEPVEDAVETVANFIRR